MKIPVNFHDMVSLLKFLQHADFIIFHDLFIVDTE